jgi:hypothetical protein
MLSLGLALAACSQGTADYNEVDIPEREARADAAIQAAAAQSGTATVARTGLPVASPTPTAARDRTLPTGFQGYWGATPDDCELANVEATGRINVDADTIRFHEAKARVVGMQRRSAYEVVADLRFTGEGQTGTRRTGFRLEAGGTTLIRTQDGAAVRYQRC